MNLYKDLQFREIIYQVTDPSLENELQSKPLTLYAGFDPTSDTLHIGSLLPIITLMRFQKAGHHPIAVIGGATGMIGDPSGKSQERQLLTEEILQKNLQGIRKVLEKFLDFKSKNAAKIANNADWFKTYSYIGFLRDIGKHFTINHMMAKESVRARLEDRDHGISYTEFSYMLLQAYDFYCLHKNNGCSLQIGGSDQWGNITAGAELIRRMSALENETHTPKVFGLTHPLVTKSDGSKFGKTESGAIWLDPARTSAYKFYQYFIQTPDADVVKLLKYFTFLSHDEINDLEQTTKTQPEKRLAQQKLAEELTTLVHGAEELKKVQMASQALFGTEIKSLNEKMILDIFSDAPSLKKDSKQLNDGIFLIDLLVESGLCKSKGAARQDVQAGGVYVNNERLNDVQFKITSSTLIASKFLVLRKGKKNYFLVSFV